MAGPLLLNLGLINLIGFCYNIRIAAWSAHRRLPQSLYPRFTISPDLLFKGPNNFRILKEDEFDELLGFDINSFKFHDKLKDSPEYAGGKEGSPQPNQQENPGIAKGPNKPEIGGKFSGSKTITIQVASFRNRKHAENLTKKLKEKGYSAYLVRKISENSVWYKVKIGNIYDSQEANSVLRALKKDGYTPIILR